MCITRRPRRLLQHSVICPAVLERSPTQPSSSDCSPGAIARPKLTRVLSRFGGSPVAPARTLCQRSQFQDHSPKPAQVPCATLRLYHPPHTLTRRPRRSSLVSPASLPRASSVFSRSFVCAHRQRLPCYCFALGSRKVDPAAKLRSSPASSRPRPDRGSTQHRDPTPAAPITCIAASP